jgi:hypothetical protein
LNQLYSGDFHSYRHQHTLHAAQQVLNIVLRILPTTKSAVDVGCGVGTWLKALNDMGTENILGVDGPWVRQDQLEIPPGSFMATDLSEDIPGNERFDLAMSFEVAEHLSSARAGSFVDSLTGFSDFVLFSAATPYQGGTGHINEQWPSYWINLFRERDFLALDVVRRKIWRSAEIPAHYRKNILLYVRESRVGDLNLECGIEEYVPPEEYLLYYPNLTSPGIKQSLHSLFNSIRSRITD